jgi:omega-amidase
MKVTLVQNAPRLNRTNLQCAIEIVQAEAKDSDVVVFPELALNGYLLQDKVFEDAWELEELSPLIDASRDVDVVIGAAIEQDSRTYNSALYLSGGRVVHLHHKVHLPNYGMFEEARYFFKGNEIATFDTGHGKAALLVCEDLWRAKTIAALAKKKPDIIYLLANSPARGFAEEGLQIEGQWDALLKSTALLCSAYVIFVNRVGFEDGLGFWGGSRVVTPKGEVEFRLPNFSEQIAATSLDNRLYAVQKWMAKID